MTAEEDCIGCFSCQLTTGNWGCNFQKLTKSARKKIGQILSDKSQALLQHSDCNVLVWTTWKHGFIPFLYQRSMLVVISSWHTLSPLVPLALFKCHGLAEDQSWPCPPLWAQSTHLLMAASGRTIQCHKAQISSDLLLKTWHRNLKSYTQMACTVTRSKPIEHLEIYIMYLQPTNQPSVGIILILVRAKISGECLQHFVDSMPWTITN